MASWAPGFFAGKIATFFLRRLRALQFYENRPQALGAGDFRSTSAPRNLPPGGFSPNLRPHCPPISTHFAKDRSYWVSRSDPVLDF